MKRQRFVIWRGWIFALLAVFILFVGCQSNSGDDDDDDSTSPPDDDDDNDSLSCPTGEHEEGIACINDVCGFGDWGDIDTSMVSIFVMQAYSDGDSDGSMKHPYTSLNDALNAASENDVIAMGVGEYSGPFSITESHRGVTVLGRCSENVIITADDESAGVEVITNRGLTLKNLGFYGGSPALSITGSREIVVSDCAFNYSQNGAVVGSEAETTLEGVSIISNRLDSENPQNYIGGAVYFHNDSEVEMNDVEILDSELMGFYFLDSTVTAENILVRSTKLYKSTYGGGLFAMRSTVSLTDFHAAENWGYGIEAYNSDFVFDALEIKNNTTWGIYIISSSTGTIENSIIENNDQVVDALKNSGIFVWESALTIRTSTVTGHCGNGLYSYETDLNVFDSEIVDNLGSNLYADGGTLDIQKNNLGNMPGADLNGYAAALILYNCTATIVQNTMDSVTRNGIYVENGAYEISENHISNVIPDIGSGELYASAIGAFDVTNLLIEDNDIENVPGFFIGATNSAGTISGNHMTNAPGTKQPMAYGITLQNHSEITVSDNTIEEISGWGILVQECDNSVITENTLSNITAHSYKPSGSGIFIRDTQGVEISQNDISNVERAGIMVGYTTGAVVEENQVGGVTASMYGDDGAGIYLQNATDAAVNDNNVSAAAVAGILLLDGSSGTMSGNVVSGIVADDNDLFGDGITILDATSAVPLDGNHVYNNARAGFLFDSSAGSYANTESDHNAFAGYLQLNAAVTDEGGNNFHDNDDDGVTISNEPLLETPDNQYFPAPERP